jgi:hypothetical protein
VFVVRVLAPHLVHQLLLKLLLLQTHHHHLQLGWVQALALLRHQGLHLLEHKWVDGWLHLLLHELLLLVQERV